MGAQGSGRRRANQDADQITLMAVEEAVNRDSEVQRLQREGREILQRQRKESLGLHHQVVISQNEEPTADELKVYPNIVKERQEHRRALDLLHEASERARVVRYNATKAARNIPKSVMAKAIAKVEQQGQVGPSGILLAVDKEEF